MLLLWKKPIIDLDTIKLVLFLLGNGCPPDLFTRWILLWQSWATWQVAKKEQDKSISSLTTRTKSHMWFYYHVDHRKLLFLDGRPRKKTQM